MPASIGALNLKAWPELSPANLLQLLRDFGIQTDLFQETASPVALQHLLRRVLGKAQKLPTRTCALDPAKEMAAVEGYAQTSSNATAFPASVNVAGKQLSKHAD